MVQLKQLNGPIMTKGCETLGLEVRDSNQMYVLLLYTSHGIEDATTGRFATLAKIKAPDSGELLADKHP